MMTVHIMSLLTLIFLLSVFMILLFSLVVILSTCFYLYSFIVVVYDTLPIILSSIVVVDFVTFICTLLSVVLNDKSHSVILLASTSIPLSSSHLMAYNFHVSLINYTIMMMIKPSFVWEFLLDLLEFLTNIWILTKPFYSKSFD